MDKLAFRQVHLDFHTSEKIENIGRDFNKKQFQDMLQKGKVNSINIFAKCHHGWAYNQSKANEQHPHLAFDLLKEMIAACHEIEVKCPIYISTGLDEKMARKHPDWLFRNNDESTTWATNFMQAGYHELCMNSPYLDYFKEQVLEIIANYDCDGVWLDIVGERVCYCQNCIRTALEKGYNPENREDMVKLGKETFMHYTTTINSAIHEADPNMPVFHNSGHITRGRDDLIQINSHLEIESLPTGGWGYDHFPLSARYAQTTGKEFIGMTGKFHTTWGEFGGFKHPNALRYECGLALSMGAKMCIGDQMHPYGALEPATYELIGKAYRELEPKESYCRNTLNVAQIAFISTEACFATGNVEQRISKQNIDFSDLGALRILQEGQYLFDIIDVNCDFNQYKVIVLPDMIKLDYRLREKLESYLNQGGKILATGDSGMNLEEANFGIDLGVEYKGKSEYCPSYCRTMFDLKDLDSTAFVMYSHSNLVEPKKEAKVLAYNEESFFNRSTFYFSSHQHTPNHPEHKTAGIIESSNGIYIPWKIFNEYSSKGEITHKQIVEAMLDRLLGDDKMLKTNLPVPSVVTLREQPTTHRHILHIVYASPIKRGNVEVIEDIPTLHNSDISLKWEKKVNKVYDAITGEAIEFIDNNGMLEFRINEFNCHCMIVIE